MTDRPNLALRAVAAAGQRILSSRRLMRAPLVAYRHGLGAVFGSRMLLLEHTGRRSGLTRQVVLEVVGHPEPDRYVVVSGFGGNAQWFRNVLADPAVRVSVGRRQSVPATARLLDDAEAARALTAYVERNRRLWSVFGSVIARTLGRPIDAETAPPPMVELAVDPSAS